MKLVKFRCGDRFGEGFLEENTIAVTAFHDAPTEGLGSGNAAMGPFTLPRCGAEGLADARAAATERLALGDVHLCAPVAPDSKIICLGYSYRSHIEETTGDAPEYPALFARWPDTLVGQDAALIRPMASETYDFEGELAVVIGRAGRRIPEADVADHILGYSCFMDGSLRAYQKHSPTAGKNFPASGAMGPWIETQQIDSDFSLQTRINGEVVQSTSGSLLLYSLARIVSYVSEFTPLSPGDVISTGTPGGVGAKRTPPLWLRAGDRVAVSISGVGTLANSVEEEER